MKLVEQALQLVSITPGPVFSWPAVQVLLEFRNPSNGKPIYPTRIINRRQAVDSDSGFDSSNGTILAIDCLNQGIPMPYSAFAIAAGTQTNNGHMLSQQAGFAPVTIMGNDDQADNLSVYLWATSQPAYGTQIIYAAFPDMPAWLNLPLLADCASYLQRGASFRVSLLWGFSTINVIAPYQFELLSRWYDVATPGQQGYAFDAPAGWVVQGYIDE